MQMCVCCVCGRKRGPSQGDLGAIDEKYDVAISTACGALDHIVVDSMETAVKCVEFLKKNSVGQATFIGLDKVCHMTISTSLSTVSHDYQYITQYYVTWLSVVT